jgi:hypothetical protein
MSPINLSVSSNITVCLPLPSQFKHHCMSPTTLSVSSNTTLCLPLLSLSVQTPLYVSHYSLCQFKHHCMSPTTLSISSNATVCLPLLSLSLCNSLLAALVRLKFFLFPQNAVRPINMCKLFRITCCLHQEFKGKIQLSKN